MELPNKSPGDQGQQYNLKWTNHTNNILSMFSDQLFRGHLVDVTLWCEGQFLKAHKMVLSACSPYFHELFNIHTVDQPLIIMNGIRYNDLKQIMEFMYRGEVKVADTDLDKVLELALNLQIKGLSNVRSAKPLLPTPSTQETHPIENNKELNNQPKRKRKMSDSPPTVPKIVTEFPTYTKLNGQPTSPENDSDPYFTSSTNDLKNKKHDKKAADRKLAPKRTKPNILKNRSSTPLSHKDSIRSEWMTDDLKNLTDKLVPKIPRPPNAFMIFANEWRKKLAKDHQGESNKEISVRLGNMWKSLPNSIKDAYYTAARKADEEHKIKYPGYYYSPKEARIRKDLKSAANFRRTVPFDAVQLVALVMDGKNEDGTKHTNVIDEVNLTLDDNKEDADDIDIETVTSEAKLNSSKENSDQLYDKNSSSEQLCN